MRKLLIALTILVGVGLLYTVFQFFDIQEFIRIAQDIPLHLVVAYLAVSTLIMMLLVARWKIICAQHNIPVPYLDLLTYRYVGFAVSFITPGPRVGGEPVRAGLMTRNDVSMPQAMSTVVADKTNELLSFGVMFIIALAGAAAILPLSTSLRVLFGAIALGLFALVTFGLTNILRGKDPILKLYKLLGLHKIKWLKKYKKQLQEFEDNIHGFYGDNPKHFWQAFTVSCLAWTLSLAEFWIILLMLGLQPTVLIVFLIYTVVGIIYLLPIPFALGSLEAGQASLFAGLGLPAAAGAVLAMITRSRDLLWTFIGLCLLGIYSLQKRKKQLP